MAGRWVDGLTGLGRAFDDDQRWLDGRFEGWTPPPPTPPIGPNRRHSLMPPLSSAPYFSSYFSPAIGSLMATFPCIYRRKRTRTRTRRRRRMRRRRRRTRKRRSRMERIEAERRAWEEAGRRTGNKRKILNSFNMDKGDNREGGYTDTGRVRTKGRENRRKRMTGSELWEEWKEKTEERLSN